MKRFCCKGMIWLLGCLLPCGSLSASVYNESWSSGFANGGIVPDNDRNGWQDTRSFSIDIPDWDIVSVEVTLDIRGGWSGDLYGRLTHGTTTCAVLLNRTGRTASDSYGYGDAGFMVTFSDAAVAYDKDIHLYRAATPSPTYNSGQLTGTWLPDGRDVDPATTLDTHARSRTLSSFEHEDPDGVWTLFLADVSGGSESTVHGWGLQITAVPEPAIATSGIFGFIAVLTAGARWTQKRARAKASCGNRCGKDFNSVAGRWQGPLAILFMTASCLASFNSAYANSPPQAGPDSAATALNTQVQIAAVKLLANDTDADNDQLSVASVSTPSTQGGTVSLASGVVTYTPPTGYSGTDTFTYTVSDGNGGSGIGTVTVTVRAGSYQSPNMVAPVVIPNGVRVRFAGITGRLYQLQRSPDLAAWTTIHTVDPMPGAGVVEYDDINPPEGTAYYRTSTPIGWLLVNSAGPPKLGIAAYDSDRHVAVMFACGSSTYSNDTWEYDGTTWRQVAVPGTLPRARDASGKIVYDSFNKKMIMQGGWWPDNNDTWTWEYRVTGPGPNDRQWVSIVAADCAYRGGNCLAYDSTHHTVLAFGGNHYQSFYNDTWRFDGSNNTWTWLLNWGLSRFAAGLVYDNARDKFVMFGGTGRWWSGDTEQGRGNTCEFDPNTGAWTEVLPQGAPGVPGPRWFPSMVYDAAAGVTVLKGGGRVSDSYTYTDTWEWNGTSWTQIPNIPGQPTAGVMWFDTARQKIVLFYEQKTWVYYR